MYVGLSQDERKRLYERHYRRTVRHLPCVLLKIYEQQDSYAPSHLLERIQEVAGIRLEQEGLEALLESQCRGRWRALRGEGRRQGFLDSYRLSGFYFEGYRCLKHHRARPLFRRK